MFLEEYQEAAFEKYLFIPNPPKEKKTNKDTNCINIHGEKLKKLGEIQQTSNLTQLQLVTFPGAVPLWEQEVLPRHVSNTSSHKP